MKLKFIYSTLNNNHNLLRDFTLLPNFGGFHRTLQRVRLSNRGRFLLRTHGPVPYGICICSTCWDQRHPISIRHTSLWHYYRLYIILHLTFHQILVSIEHLQQSWQADRGRLLLRTPGPVPFGTCICSNVETILSWTCHVYGPFEFRTSLGTSILLQNIAK